MHTFLSDGTPSPKELVEACISLQLDEISITDHDSIGCYPEVLELVKGTPLRIIPGAELDCTYGDTEIHMLGLGLDIESIPLRRHLTNIQAARKKRAFEQADAINLFYGRKLINLERICARCQTFMNPHLIHEMIDQGLFDSCPPPDRYKQAQIWMRENIKVDSVIEKPTVERMIALIHAAGGIAVLAHPGYYMKNGLNIHQVVSDLKEMGMDGLEVTYPYHQQGSREFPTPAHEQEAILLLEELAQTYELHQTTGSDAHEIEQLKSFHSRA